MSTITDQPSQYECPVCHEHFTTPKILPCAHVLCRPCLIKWLKSDSDVRCPLCRDVIVSAEAKAVRSCDDIADTLPTDLAMQTRMECATILSKTHECEGCKSTDATSICLNCGDLMCGVCATAHRNLSATKHHQVEELSTMTAERLAFSRHVPCKAHSDKTSELYCPIHGAAICHLCASSTHRSCPEVRDVEEKVEEARRVLSELAATLKAGESRLERTVAELDRLVLDMDKAQQATLADIDNFCDRLQRSVDTCRERLRDQAQKPYTNAKNKVETVKATLLKQRGKVTSHWRLVYSVGDCMPRVCGVSDMTSKLKAAVHDLGLEAELKVVTKTTLTFNEKALQRLAKELSEVGQVTGEPTVEVTLKPSPQAKARLQGWRFHSIHGHNIVLKDEQRTAKRAEGDRDAIVMSEDAMMDNILYEIRIIATKGDTAGAYMGCGVTDGDPADITLPPKGPNRYWKQAVTVSGGLLWQYGLETGSTVGYSLLGLRVESRAGVLVDSDNCLHLYVDGHDKGVLTRDIRRPCHALFDVSYVYRKVSTLPLKTLTGQIFQASTDL